MCSCRRDGLRAVARSCECVEGSDNNPGLHSSPHSISSYLSKKDLQSKRGAWRKARALSSKLSLSVLHIFSSQ